MERDYGSRKFITTNGNTGMGVFCVMFGAIYDVPDGYWTAMPALFILLAAGISAYNWANLRSEQNGHAPR